MRLSISLNLYSTILTPKSVSRLAVCLHRSSLKIRSLREEESLHSTIKEISYFSGIIDTFLLKATRESTCKKSVQDLLCKSRKFTLELRKKLEDYSFKQKITCMSKEKLFTYDFKCFCFLFTFLIKAKLIVP